MAIIPTQPVDELPQTEMHGQPAGVPTLKRSSRSRRSNRVSPDSHPVLYRFRSGEHALPPSSSPFPREPASPIRKKSFGQWLWTGCLAGLACYGAWQSMVQGLSVPSGRAQWLPLFKPEPRQCPSTEILSLQTAFRSVNDSRFSAHPQTFLIYQDRQARIEQRVLSMGMPTYDYISHSYQLLPNVLGVASKLFTAIRMGQLGQRQQLAGMAHLMWLQTVPYQTLEMLHQIQGMIRTVASWRPTYAQSMQRLWFQVQGEDQALICHMPPEHRLVVDRLYQMVQQQRHLPTATWHMTPGETIEPNRVSGMTTLETDHLYQRALQLRSLLLSIPSDQQVQDVSHQHRQGNTTRRMALDQRVNQLIHSYDNTLQHSLRDLIAQIRSNVYVETPQRAQAYFYGPPGVGKTYLVRELGKALDVPVVNIMLDPKTFRQQLLGHPIPHLQSWLQSKLEPQTILGALAYGMIETGIVNPILFIDELNDIGGEEHRLMLRGLLKMLLDPQLTSLPILPEHNVTISFSRATVLLAGNEPITDKAIRSRLRQITFGSLPFATREKVGRQTLAELEHNTMALEPEAQKMISQYCEQSLQRILNVDHRYQLPGVRVLMQVIRQFHSYVQDAVLTDRLEQIADEEEQLLNHWYEQFGATPPLNNTSRLMPGLPQGKSTDALDME